GGHRQPLHPRRRRRRARIRRRVRAGQRGEPHRHRAQVTVIVPFMPFESTWYLQKNSSVPLCVGMNVTVALSPFSMSLLTWSEVIEKLCSTPPLFVIVTFTALPAVAWIVVGLNEKSCVSSSTVLLAPPPGEVLVAEELF